MNLELNLMELNSLYVAVSNQFKVAKQEAMEYPSDYFQSQLVTAEELVEKVQEALYVECARVDEAIATARDEKIIDLEIEIEVLESERNYYASRGDWEYCELINEKIEQVKELINELNK
jgi:hypothetical protein